jgi:hypothetical protein
VSAANLSFSDAMRAAAKTRGVPLPLIEATAYVNVRWEWITSPALGGGVGPMNIVPAQMAEAALLSGHSSSEIAGDLADNLDAGAALLAKHHAGASDLASWHSTVVAVDGPYVATEIFDALRTGATRTTSTGETITMDSQPLPPSSPAGAISAPATATAGSITDYAGATWVPAATSNYSVANRPRDYTVDMIIIHDIEGSYGSAIQLFQTTGNAASANYVVSYRGQVSQMVREKDIAWHAGNWDYNTRAIGIEHEGYAWTPGLYTTAEYNASAAIAASICSRWGVPLDRTHVIGHSQVPDPNNPNRFGGSGHHTDPGPYWNWTYYMSRAQADANALTSPPHMMPDPVAVNGPTSVTVTWRPARSCRAATYPITGYTIVGQPGNLTISLPASTTTYTFQNLTPETTYTFTVTAHNAFGDDSLTSNPATPGRCVTVGLTANPASPQKTSTAIQLTGTSTGCPNPRYELWMLAPGSSTWQRPQAYSANATNAWTTSGLAAGFYTFSMWAQDAASPGNGSDSLGTWDAYSWVSYALNPAPCPSLAVTASPPTSAMVGTTVSLTAAATGCPTPRYEFWLLPPGSTTWQAVQAYSTGAGYSWSTAGKPPGVYRYSIWARDASSVGIAGDSLGRWDSYVSGQYTLTRQPCGGVGVASAPPSGAAAGTVVSITGTASGCPNPHYEFWMLAPGAGAWQQARPYSASATLSWSTTGRGKGTYRFSVWSRDASSTGLAGDALGTWDAYATIDYALS